MKNTKIIAFLLFAHFGIQSIAQNPVINIEDDNGSAINNAYYKDTNHLLNPFMGTWILDDGTHYLKIVLIKKEQLFTGSYYEDMLIGEIFYSLNGQVLINTLNRLNDPDTFPENRHHSIDGNYIITRAVTPFDDYTSDNFRIGLIMSEPNGFSSNVDIRRTTISGDPAIQIFKRGGMVTIYPGEPTPPDPIIPNGFHFLIRE